jgi:hypothetical protein
MWIMASRAPKAGMPAFGDIFVISHHIEKTVGLCFYPN